jgi:hypothetical protein
MGGKALIYEVNDNHHVAGKDMCVGVFRFIQGVCNAQENPDMMQQAMDMMSKMSPADMEAMTRMATSAGAGPGPARCVQIRVPFRISRLDKCNDL